MAFLHNWIRGKKSFAAQAQANHKLNTPISSVLAQNIADLHELFSQTPDLVVRHFVIKQTGNQAAIAYLDGLTDKKALNDDVLRPLQFEADADAPGNLPRVNVGNVRTLSLWSDLEMAMLQGVSILFEDGRSEAVVFNTQGWPQRAIEDPQLEASLKGAHQGFVETGTQNIALIRRYIPHRELKIKELTIGRRGNTLVSILYMADIVHPEVLKEIEDRIRQLDIDAVINTGELAELIEDNPYSPFPQFIATERPDSAAAQLLQGRFVVIVDRSPSVLIGPVTFTSFFQSVDDYSTRWMVASFTRLLRFMGFTVAVFLPALYIAVISFNYEVIPLQLLLSIGESRARVPFPPLVEALLMEITLEMMREAGVRLPAPVGQTVGIVGGIVIGQAAVSAGIVSNIMVIIVAITAVSSFIIPDYDMASALRLIRFPMMVLAMMFGMVGIVIGLAIFVLHLIAMESVGVPYGSPVAPIRIIDWKDVWMRMPLWKMNKRPFSANPAQLKRQGPSREGDDQKR
ncbi:spore gernimation protein [Paenibacillus sp. A3]|uniref:spore germination protein n=1 Tax=Paenibacillus sp. A3 TaxID=1337054 RepID=UPI0006D59919|nr:spore germination protein [Paenibacillus sp. A3]KPV59890.1 spore gernimation protein [Paenibacillus sp. A3]